MRESEHEGRKMILNAATLDLCHELSLPNDLGEGFQALLRHNEDTGTFGGRFRGANQGISHIRMYGNTLRINMRTNECTSRESLNHIGS